MKNVNVTLFIFIFLYFFQVNNIATNMLGKKEYSKIPITVENLKENDKALNIIIPSEVVKSFLCRKLEELCFLKENFLKEKIMKKQIIKENSFKVSDSELGKAGQTYLHIKNITDFSVPEFYYNECRYYYNYYEEDLIKAIDDFISNKILTSTLLINRFKVLHIGIPNKDILFMAYYLLDSLNVSDKIKKIDLIVFKSDRDEHYLYRIIKGERLTYSLRRLNTTNQPLKHIINGNNRFYTMSFKEKINKFKLLTTSDRLYSSVDIKHYKNKNFFICRQDAFDFYNNKFKDKSLLAVYYFDLIVDFSLDFLHKLVKFQFPEICLNYSYDVKVKCNSFTEEMTSNPQLTAINLEDINRIKDGAYSYDDNKNINSNDTSNNVKYWNQSHDEDEKLPTKSADIKFDKNYNLKSSSNPLIEYQLQLDPVNVKNLFEIDQEEKEKKKLDSFNYINFLTESEKITNKKHNSLNNEINKIGNLKKSQMKMRSFSNNENRKNNLKFEPGNFLIDYSRFFNSTQYLDETLNENLEIAETNKTSVKKASKKKIFNNIIRLQTSSASDIENDLPHPYLVQLKK